MLHHQKGLELATSAMSLVTEDNCTPLFVFSLLTCLFAVAQPRKPADFILVGDTGLSEWLVILQGSTSIFNFAKDPLLAGPLGPLFVTRSRRASLRGQLFSEQQPIEAYRHLEEVRMRINNSAIPLDERQIYSLSLEELRSPLAVIFGQVVNTYESGDVFIWVLHVPKEFLMLLKEHRQEALAIFAMFAVIVKPLESNWWIEGLSQHLISTIYSLIDDEHREWIQWPMKEVGWVPPDESFSGNDDMSEGVHGQSHLEANGALVATTE